MPDKKCPKCGLLNAQAALVCDCGFEFTPRPGEAALYTRGSISVQRVFDEGIVYGILGILVAILPSLIIYLVIVLTSVSGQPFDVHSDQLIRLVIYFWTVGRSQYLQLYVSLIVISGIAAGILSLVIGWRTARSKSPKASPRTSLLVFWLAFGSGLVFNVVVLFKALFLGQ